MESWRERGFVPDSDEEDDFTSQEAANPCIDGYNSDQTSCNTAVRIPTELKVAEIGANIQDSKQNLHLFEDGDEASKPACLGQLNEKKDAKNHVQSAQPRECVPSTEDITVGKEEQHTIHPTVEEQDRLAISDPKQSFLKAEQPQAVLDQPSSPDELQLDNWPTQRRVSPPVARCDAWPQITSEASSQLTLSPLPEFLDSPHSVEDDVREVLHEHKLASKDDSDDLPPLPPAESSHLNDSHRQIEHERSSVASRDYLVDLIPELDIPEDILQELSKSTGRSLRRRNPIQLRPYLLENAKYQSLMRARGVKPVRVAQYENTMDGVASTAKNLDPARASVSPVSDRQFLPSSSPEHYQQRQKLAEFNAPKSQDFMGPPRLAHVARNIYKRRKIAHSGHDGDHQHLPALLRLDREGNENGYMNGPRILSPPRSESVSSAPTADFSGEFRFPRGATPAPLTTPVTESRLQLASADNVSTMGLSSSVSGQSVEVLSILSESQPSSDEEDTVDREVMQMRRQIKGVLPASWLRLDFKNQEARMRSSQRKRDLARKLVGTKGVAKRLRKSGNTTTNSASRQEWMSMMDLADNDENESDSDVRSYAQADTDQTLADLVGFEDPFHDQAGDDVLEDNRIDYMLLPVSRSKLGQGRRPVKQRRHELNNASTRGSRKRIRVKQQTRITDPVYGTRKEKRPVNKHRRPAILNAPDISLCPREEQLPFLRVAIRQARLRHEGRKQSNTSKTFSLQSRHFVENSRTSSLQRQRVLPEQPSLTQFRSRSDRRESLGARSTNKQLALSIDTGDSYDGVVAGLGTAALPDGSDLPPLSGQYPNILDSVSKPMDDTGSRLPNRLGNKWVIRRNLAVSSLRRNTPRPAMPEMEDVSGDFAFPSIFQRSLSQLNQDYRQRRAAQARNRKISVNDSSISNPPPATVFGNQYPDQAVESSNLGVMAGNIQSDCDHSIHLQPRPRQLKKRPPKRLPLAKISQESSLFLAEDTGYLKPSCQESVVLSSFQQSYTVDFGATPIRFDVSFHKSTFLGSGEFSRSQAGFSRDMDSDVGPSSITFGGRNYQWGPWNELVSCGLGSAFNVLIEWAKESAMLHSEGDLAVIATHGCALYRSLIKYTTETLSFSDPVDRTGFVIRAHDLVDKLRERLSASDLSTDDARGYAVKLCTYNLVFASQIHHVASHNLVSQSLANGALELVYSVACQLFAFIASTRGLKEIRESLQGNKLSEYRDTSFNVGPCAEGFVIAQHLLRGSGKYDGWLEDITMKAHLPSFSGEAAKFNRIQSLEIGWQLLFTTIPLCEIDQYGVAYVGSRFNGSFDNWKFVQQLLSPVLGCDNLSLSYERISYNSYCRILFRRCFHLINDWGWRHCKPILDTLYDFFARRMLYNLSHEECLGSPDFLENLDRDPSLAVSARDSCFRILLKIIGSGLRFMSKTHDMKKIRNYAWRLLPNHGRVYPKEMPLRQEDLDALRNHHDLLCTLYWAVPEGCRPRLETVKNLVSPSSSHREACKISLKSWMRLTRFKLSAGEDASGLDQFANWHAYFMTELLKQHGHARTEVETQNDSDSRFSHEVIERMISQNQQQIELLLSTALSSLYNAVQLSPTPEHAWRLMSKSPAKTVLNLFNPKLARVNSVVSEALRVIMAYVKRHNAPSFVPTVTAPSDDDSQEYGDWKEIFAQEDSDFSQGVEYIQQTLHPAVSRLVSNCFGEDQVPEDSFLVDVVDCWTSVAHVLVTRGQRHWDSYLSPYNGDSWMTLRATMQTRKFTPQFLASCMEKDSRFFSECKAQVLGIWMSTLVERASILKFQHRLTEALLNQNFEYPLMKNLPFSKSHKDGRYYITLEDFSQRRLSLISSLLSNMREHVQGIEDTENWEYKAAKQEYGELIQKLMSSMKSNYQELGNGAQLIQSAYVDFVHCVVGFLQQHTRDLSAIDTFFTDPKSFPLPSADPRYIVAKLKSYEPKLSSERAVKALIVFIQGVSERAATDGEQAYLVGQLSEAIANTYEGGSQSHPTLRATLLQYVFPAYLEVAFEHPASWILSRPIVQTITFAFKELLFSMDTMDSSSVLSVTNILTSVFRATYRAFHFLSEYPNTLRETTALITAAAFIDMITASLVTVDYIDRVTDSGDRLVHQVQAFRHFILFALSNVRGGTSPSTLEEFYRLAPAFVPVSSTSTSGFQASSGSSSPRELLSYISSSYTYHQGKYYFTRRSSGCQPKEVNIDAAVAVILESKAAELGFEDIAYTFMDHLRTLSLFDGDDID